VVSNQLLQLRDNILPSLIGLKEAKAFLESNVKGGIGLKDVETKLKREEYEVIKSNNTYIYTCIYHGHIYICTTYTVYILL